MDTMMTKREVCATVGYSGQHIARLESQGSFPRRIKPGKLPNSKAFWLKSEIQAWIEQHVTDRS